MVPTLIIGSNKDSIKYADFLLDFVGLTSKKYMYPNQLSGGERSRVATLRAVINKPSIIFADEPTGNLDKLNSLLLIKLFLKINKDFEQSIVISTHNPDVAAIGNNKLILENSVIREKHRVIMKENFSKRLQRIIKRSKEEAIRLGHSYVGSEHLLLALLKEKNGLSHKIFNIFDLQPSEMISLLEEMVKSSGGTMTLGHLPLTRRAERVLKNSFSEAASNGKTIADDEYLLLSILKEKQGVAYEVLKSFSLDYNTVNDLINVKNDNDTLESEKDASLVSEKTPTLDHFSRDITSMAIKEDLDPVIG